MKNTRRIAVYVLEILIGIGLLIASQINLMDPFWSGMGAALIVVGAVRLIQMLRYSTSEDYRESVDVAVNDERNKYLRMKAWSWTGYIFVVIAAIATILLKVLGYDSYSRFAGFVICLLVLLYWLCWVVLSKKY